MNWHVEYTDEFGRWFQSIRDDEQNKVAAVVNLLEEYGPHLPFPHSSAIQASRHTPMRELRIQARGRPLRIFYAFDPRQIAILLIGGLKKGNKSFYRKFIPLADRLYDLHLKELKDEGFIK